MLSVDCSSVLIIMFDFALRSSMGTDAPSSHVLEVILQL